jgi:hypothetical protein
MRKDKRGPDEIASDPFRDRAYATPSKALVMSKIGKLVRDGLADWTALENGDIRLRLLTGEIPYLGEEGISRLNG